MAWHCLDSSSREFGAGGAVRSTAPLPALWSRAWSYSSYGEWADVISSSQRGMIYRETCNLVIYHLLCSSQQVQPMRKRYIHIVSPNENNEPPLFLMPCGLYRGFNGIKHVRRSNRSFRHDGFNAAEVLVLLVLKN